MRCIAIDISGSGLSELGRLKLSITSIVEYAIGQFDVLGIKEDVTVVGHSMAALWLASLLHVIARR